MASRSTAWYTRVMPWIARAGWVIVAVVGGAALEAAVDSRSQSVQWVTAIGGWAIWATVALALAIASVRTLTAARVGAPLSLVAATATAISGAPAADIALLAIPALIGCMAIYSAEFGRQFVQASAYGAEQRFPLRGPAAATAAAIAAWVVWSPVLIAGPLLIAAKVWIPGILLTLAASAATVFLMPRWHRLSQRWFVFVPAGIVLHDPVVLADTLALRKAQVAQLRLAPTDTEAADFTGPASGYAIEVSTTESITAVYAFTPSEPQGRAIHLTAFLVAPSRPGRVLQVAADRGLRVS